MTEGGRCQNGYDDIKSSRRVYSEAKTAVAYGRDTKATMENFANRTSNYYIVGMSGLYPGEFWAGPGGTPIVVAGEVIGGVGVSGSTPGNDHKCVREALVGLKVE